MTDYEPKPEVPITIAMPLIPPRGIGGGSHKYAHRVEGIPYLEGGGLYEQAVYSIHHQSVKPAGGIVVSLDTERRGAAFNRQRALDMVTTEYVSFMDDDDLAYTIHIETHWNLLREHNADVAYSWFTGNNPFPKHRGRQWDPDQPHHTTMTITVRTELAKAIGFHEPNPLATQDCAGEDFMFILGLNDLGAKFVGTGEVTWHYRLHDHHTSGLGHRW